MVGLKLLLRILYENKKTMIWIIIGFLFMVFLNTANNSLVSSKRNLGKQITFDDSSKRFNSVNDSILFLSDLINQSQKKFKIVSLVNASCSDCIEELQGWRRIRKLIDSVRVDIILIAYDAPFDMVKYNVVDVAKFKQPVFYDCNNHFSRINNLQQGDFKTFLIDTNNKIVISGNPIKNPHLIKSYKELIR